MRIHHTARTHGISDDDMLHAVHHPMGQNRDYDSEFAMLLGPDRSGQLLEVGVLGVDEDDPVIIHAMVMRPKYRRFLDERG